MRVRIADIGTNSTRLLLADVDPATGAVTELERRSTVTRLGQGVDATGALAPEAMARVHAALDEQDALAAEHGGVEATLAVLTSAVRDACNGAAFTQEVRDRHGLDARTLSGDEEAHMSFLGATSERPADAPAPVVVIDIGGGSTELIVGARGDVAFHVSTQAGVVRFSERLVHADPPEADELAAVAAAGREAYEAAVPADVRARPQAAIAVAGTATSLAAIAQDLDPYDPARVHGFRLDEATIELQLARLAQMTVEERRHVAGLHPDRAPTIVPGAVLLREALALFGLGAAEVSEHDILRGAALTLAGA